MNNVTVSIKDFQIIEKATLTFDKGLNCIIGPSNNGKSAIFRAIMSLLYNEPGTDRIRKGCNSYAVGLQVNGNTILFQKGVKESLYKINNVVYQKPGRSQLEEVASATGIKELNLNGKNEQLNFWYQMEKPFLLDRSETDLFRFIVDSGKDNRTTVVLKQMVSDRQTKSSEINVLEGRIAQLEADLETYNKRLEGAEDKISLCNKVVEYGPIIKRLELMLNLMQEIKELKESINATKVKIENYIKALNIISKTNEVLEACIAREEVYKTVLNNISNYRDKVNLLKAKTDKVKTYLNAGYASKIEKTLKIEILYYSISNLGNKIKELKKKLDLYNAYKGVDESIINRVTSIELLNTKINLTRNSYNKIEVDLNDVKKELEGIKEKIGQFKICPLCNRPF